MAHLAYGRMALQKVTDMTNVDLATLRTFDLRPYVTPRAVVTSASHLSVDASTSPTPLPLAPPDIDRRTLACQKALHVLGVV